jgi:hypothetical protein
MAMRRIGFREISPFLVGPVRHFPLDHVLPLPAIQARQLLEILRHEP